MSVKSWLDENIYPAYHRNWDNQLFSEKIRDGLQEDHQVLDLGAGAGIVPCLNFQGQVARVCGIDPDERVLGNPHLDEAVVAQAEDIPFPDNRFDLVVSANVLEHLRDPAVVFDEVYRVLKPNGTFWFKTPNKWHYVALIARVTPHGFHEYVNRIRGREEHDTYPTLYRVNSRRKIREVANDAGFRDVDLRVFEGRPEYLRMTALTYLLGMIYEKTVNRFGGLQGLRAVVLGSARK
jgi:ubiquinone/menaquinone biosynthesis C-methylase UbiE